MLVSRFLSGGGDGDCRGSQIGAVSTNFPSGDDSVPTARVRLPKEDTVFHVSSSLVDIPVFFVIPALALLFLEYSSRYSSGNAKPLRCIGIVLFYPHTTTMFKLGAGGML